MNEYLLVNEPSIRLGVFLSILVVMMLLEVLAPKRKLTCNKPYRWVNNISLVAFNTLLLRLVIPAGAVGVALYCEQYSVGLFHYLSFSLLLTIVVSIFIMDLVIYWQHRMFHTIPVLWKLHRVHHIDQDIDVTTGARFHPIEIILSVLIKMLVVLLLGAPVEAVILFEIILNATAMFNHSNVHIPAVLDKWIRWVLVTPDMHRVHHSQIRRETDSNFGFNVPWWDRIFSSYQDQPKLGHDKMNIGVKGFDDMNRSQNILKLLIHPFSK